MERFQRECWMLLEWRLVKNCMTKEDYFIIYTPKSLSTTLWEFVLGLGQLLWKGDKWERRFLHFTSVFVWLWKISKLVWVFCLCRDGERKSMSTERYWNLICIITRTHLLPTFQNLLVAIVISLKLVSQHFVFIDACDSTIS